MCVRTNNGHYGSDGHQKQAKRQCLARIPKAFFRYRFAGGAQDLHVHVCSAIQTRHPVRGATLPHRTANKLSISHYRCICI